ncbi:MAG TPA: hypothetical protein VK501_10490 [Baekduia sp.]|uniref:hypothetical protein n=1 Tax=Baekduia sp. TaxID=2600305 RepID=UPI002C54B518|nr:hypothetical protein [Baekduia sp.]HMJ34337.1 hypothetical protein [Baekduia sp.]
MTPDVEKALAAVRRAFDGHAVETMETGDGGVHVIVEDLDLGPAFTPERSWIGFTIPFNHPLGDVYPHFVRPDLARADGTPLMSPLNAGQVMPGFERPATMLSRRSNHWNPSRDTAALKLMRIVGWFADEAQPVGSAA